MASPSDSAYFILSQGGNWKAGHSVECAIYSKLYPRILPLPVRAILRVILSQDKDKVSPYIHEEFLDLSYPKEIYDDDENEEANDHFLMAEAVLKYGDIEYLDEDYVEQLFGKLSANSFTLTSAFGKRRGVYLHPAAARFNHSCNPNASYSFDKGKCYIRATKPIAKGEQIFIPYIDTTYSVGTRRHELKERYKFDCQCPRCLNEIATTDPEEVKKRSEQELTTNSQIDEVLVSNIASGFDAAWKLSSMIRTLEEKAGWDVVNAQQQPLAAIRSEIMASKAMDELYKMSAVDAAIRHLRTDPAQYPDENHPMRREHALEFVYHLLYANEIMRQEAKYQGPEDTDAMFNIHKISPHLYAWMVLNWMLYGDVNGKASETTRKKMEEAVWTNPTAKADAERILKWLTEELKEVGTTGAKREREVEAHAKKMEEVVQATLTQEKRNM
uniref:Histone-lysine N-methyltransferase SMYD3 n=1 Tax=Talaromyces marneffei PM1 TaxID=1077442 RepID=A0A093V0Y1_TALMA